MRKFSNKFDDFIADISDKEKDAAKKPTEFVLFGSREGNVSLVNLYVEYYVISVMSQVLKLH